LKLLNEHFFNILALDKEFAFQLADMFKDSTTDILNQFESSLEDKDVKSCQNLIHTAKGSAASFGAESLINLLNSVEIELLELTETNIEIFQTKSKQARELLKETLTEVESLKN